jgi:hypothetical protein
LVDGRSEATSSPSSAIARRAGDVIGNVDFERLARVVSGLERTILALASR